MNGSKSPDASGPDGPERDDHVSAVERSNGDASPSTQLERAKTGVDASLGSQDTELPDVPTDDATAASSAPNGDNDEAESEAETLITSPVKKKEAEKQQQLQPTVKAEPKAQRNRIGGLPVPGDDDEDPDSAESPLLSTENATPARKDEDAQMLDEAEGSDRDAEGSESEELSSPQSDEDADGEEDEDVERSENESGAANGAESPNPRKRKHRASSSSLPNSKRRSMDPPKRTLRGMHSEADAVGIEHSTLARPQNHRRAVSTQSALEAASEGGPGRKRKGMAQYPVKEPKSATSKSGWEESDASSETASRGQPEELFKRPQRGVGRSTSTPGRPSGREHKRHINKYGFTRLAEACEEGNLEQVKELREKDPDSLELAEFAGNKPLQIAALNGNAEVVKYLIGAGCQIDCANVDKDTPLIDAAENGHIDVVRLLLDAGVDPLSQNLKGQQALDVVTDETDDAPEIRTALHKAIDAWNSSSARQKRAVEEENRHGTGPSKELHFMARTYENLLRLVANNDRNGVREFLAARVPVDNAVIAVAAKTGDVYLVNMLLAEMSEKKAAQRAEKPMLAVLGSSHWEMVQALTELETFNPLYHDRQGRNWPALATDRGGPNWRQERDLLQRLHDQQAKNMARRSSSPVSRRDGGGKRFLRRPNANGEGSDEDTPADLRKKNGRRLMSRKDMRAASGKALSETSEEGDDADADGDSEEDEDGADTAMGPPDTPNRLRAAGRTRSKSAASQVSDVSPRNRRRSSSLRESGSNENSLPALKEAAEEAEVKTEDVSKAEEAKFAIEQAQRLAAKQQEEAEAEAEAKRAEEAEAARVRMEEARKAEEQRKQQEAEEAERARQKAAEEAEAERQRQLARDKEAAEAREAREKKKKDLLTALPRSLGHVLHPESEFTYEGLEEKAYLVQHFTPLTVLATTDDGEWVLNLQAAALVGKDGGLAMLLEEESDFHALPLESALAERSAAEEVLAKFPTMAKCDADALMTSNEDDFEAELAHAAERLKTLATLRQMLSSPPTAGDAPFTLRLVKLSDVRQRVHPLLRDVHFEIDHPRPPAPDVKVFGDTGPTNFFAGMRKLVQSEMRSQSADGMAIDADPVQWTEVAVVHEK